MTFVSMPDLYLILMLLEFNHRQCTCNVTLRSVHATIVAVEKERVTYTECVCVCSLRYPACSARAPYYVVFCGLPGCTVSSHILINGTIFEKQKLLNLKCVLIFSTNFVSNISHCKKN